MTTDLLPAGSSVPVTVTFLEMTARPSYPRPSLPIGPPTALIRAVSPPAWYFLSLYGAVGRDWEWTDWFQRSEAEVTGFVGDPEVHTYTLMRDGWPAGFFMLDHREPETADLAYFGLVPQAIGLRLGSYLLKTAIHAAWDHPGVTRMTVETCTLDHPRALGQYQKCGFVPVGQAEKTHTLSLPREMPITTT